MRHGKRFNHLGRTPSHRKAMLSNMASSLLVNKRINTTLAKAKELRKYVEPLITKAKDDSTHSRRVVFSYLQDKESVNALFNEVVDRVANRPGGYTRIIKLGSRLGDNAEMAMIELVDFNDLLITESEPKKAKTRRSRRGSKPKQESAAAKTDEKAEKKEEVEEAKSEDKIESAPTEDVAEVKTEEVQEEVKEKEDDKIKGEEVESKAEKAEVKEVKKPSKKAEKPADTKEVPVEDVKAEAKDESESTKKAEDTKDGQEGSEDSPKGESEK